MSSHRYTIEPPLLSFVHPRSGWCWCWNRDVTITASTALRRVSRPVNNAIHQDQAERTHTRTQIRQTSTDPTAPGRSSSSKLRSGTEQHHTSHGVARPVHTQRRRRQIQEETKEGTPRGWPCPRPCPLPFRRSVSKRFRKGFEKPPRGRFFLSRGLLSSSNLPNSFLRTIL